MVFNKDPVGTLNISIRIPLLFSKISLHFNIDGDTSDLAHEINMTIIPDDICTYHWGSITDTRVCAASKKTLEGACHVSKTSILLENLTRNMESYSNVTFILMCYLGRQRFAFNLFG